MTCKSALTGSGGHYRLNPYVGCEHACAYCYATYIARWRGQSGPWGSWVQAKTNIADVLERELGRRAGIEVFLSTVCDVYQQVEEELRLTRQCLEVLLAATQWDPGLRVTILTKSDLVVRDLDLLSAFPPGRAEVSFSLTTHRDDAGALLEPGAAPPSARFAAARALREAGVPASILINPVLPYVTERDLPGLVKAIEEAGAQFGGFDLCNYLSRHVGAKLRSVYARLGSKAAARLEEARRDPGYEEDVRALVQRATAGASAKASRR